MTTQVITTFKNRTRLRSWLRNFEWNRRELIQHAKEHPMFLPLEYFASENKAFYPERSIELCHNSIRSKVSFRQLDCLYLHAKGFTWPHIAAMLDLSVRTVETHLASIKNSFGLTSRDELAQFALANSLLQTYSLKV